MTDLQVLPPLAAEIRDKHALAQRQMAGTIALRNETLCTIHDCGSLLEQLRDSVPKGDFLTYTQTVLGFEGESALAYIRVATTTDRERLRLGCAREVRAAMIQTDLLPDKERTGQPGDFSIQSKRTHLPFVNQWHKWKRGIETGRAAKISEDDLRNDTRDVYEWLRALHGDANK